MDNSIHVKVKLLQTQMAVLSMTVTSLQVQVKQLEEILLKPKINLDDVHSDINIDDNDSDNYSSDELPITRIKTKIVAVPHRKNNFIMVPNDSDVESGYEDSAHDSDSDSELEIISTFSRTRLSPSADEKITNELIARAKLEDP